MEWNTGYLLFGALFGFVWAFGILLSPALLGERIRIFLLLFFSSLWLLGAVSFFAGWTKQFTVVYGTHIPFAIGIAPILYVHFQTSLLGLQLSKTEFFLHFLPSIASILIFLPFWAGREEFRSMVLERSKGMEGYSSILTLMLVSPKICILAYFLPLLWAYRSYLFREETNEREESARRMFLVYLSLITLVIFWGLIGTFLKRADFIKESIYCLPALLVLGFLLSQREPNWLGFVGKSLREVRYKKSRLKGMDENKLKDRLEVLMKREKMYADEDLTLSQLAHELHITNHQLSEFLNQRLSMKFSDYVNLWRVEEAKILLLEDPDRSILAISESVGFNSKSAFNEAFKKFTESTPSEFRKTAVQYKLSIKF